jgi:hypothetical protein
MHKVTVLPLGVIGIEPPQELLPATFLVMLLAERVEVKHLNMDASLEGQSSRGSIYQSVLALSASRSSHRAFEPSQRGAPCWPA